jgi:hypothetical protein
MAVSVTGFVRKLNEDDTYRNQFFTASDPVEFLISETGITIPDDQKHELREYIQGLSRRFPGRRTRLTSEGIEVTIELDLG